MEMKIWGLTTTSVKTANQVPVEKINREMAGVWLNFWVRCGLSWHAFLFELPFSDVLNLTFAQDNTERFMAPWAIEKSDF